MHDPMCQRCESAPKAPGARKFCEPCKAGSARDRRLARYAASPAEDRPWTAAWRAANPERVRKNYTYTRAEYERRYFLLRRYNLTLEQHQALLDAQGGRCAICQELPGKRRLSVDHDHSCCPAKDVSCGKCVRGLLCNTCNCRVVAVLEGPLVSAALAYLRRHAA